MEEFDSRIERYLRHQMTEDEDIAFLEELKSDKNLQRQAKQVAMLIKVGASKEEKTRKEIFSEIFSVNVDSLIDDYIRHRMTPSQESAFEEQIHSDKELRDKVRATVLLINQASHDTKDRDLIIEDVHKPSFVLNINNILQKNWIGYAAMITVVLGLGYGGLRVNRNYELGNLGKDLYANNFDASRQNVVSRGSECIECDSALIQIKQQIELDNNQIALEKLSDLYDKINRDKYTCCIYYKSDITRLYIIAHLKNGDKDEAIALLDKIINEDPSSPDAVWAKDVKIKVEDIW